MNFPNLEKLVLEAAVRCVYVENAGDKRAAVLYYVETLIADLRVRRKYDMAWQVRNLWREMKTAPNINSLWVKYGCKRKNPIPARAGSFDRLGAANPPYSNTGVTPPVKLDQHSLEVQNEAQ